jgi:hypothetical protein
VRSRLQNAAKKPNKPLAQVRWPSKSKCRGHFHALLLDENEINILSDLY